MGIYVKFTKTTHQIWSCHVTLASNSENFYFSPNSILNFRKVTKFGGNWLKNKKLQAKNKLRVENTPSAYRVKVLDTENTPSAYRVKVTRHGTVALPKTQRQLCIYQQAVLINDFFLYIILRVIVCSLDQYSVIKYPFVFIL